MTETQIYQIMAKHGLSPPKWVFKWNKRKTVYGLCFFPFKNKPGRIELSSTLMPLISEEEMLDSLLHEISHALVCPNRGHGPIWKKKALEIGAKPARCGPVIPIKGNLVAVCGICQKMFRRFRKPSREMCHLKCYKSAQTPEQKQLSILKFRKV